MSWGCSFLFQTNNLTKAAQTGKEVFSADEKESESLNNMGKSPFAPGVTCRLISAPPSFSLCACAPIDQQIYGLSHGMGAC